MPNVSCPRVVTVLAAVAVFASSCSSDPAGQEHSHEIATSNGISVPASGGSVGAELDSPYPIEFDSCGENIRITSEPKRVLSLGVVGLNNIIAAGASDRVVGRAGEFNHQANPDVDAYVNSIRVIREEFLDLDEIARQQVDVTYGEGYLAVGGSPEELQNRGIKALLPSTNCGNHYPDQAHRSVSLADVPTEIRRLGKLFNTSTVAEEKAVSLETSLELVDVVGNNAVVESVVVVESDPHDDNVYGFGAGTIVDDMIKRMGYENATEPAYDARQGALLPEDLVASDPDVLIVAYGRDGQTFLEAKQQVGTLPGVRNMRAFRNDNVLGMDAAATLPIPLAISEMVSVAGQIAEIDSIE